MRADASCVLIHDAFPKARHHALVLPREPGLQDVTSLTRAHLPLLDRMEVCPNFSPSKPIRTCTGHPQGPLFWEDGSATCTGPVYDSVMPEASEQGHPSACTVGMCPDFERVLWFA